MGKHPCIVIPIHSFEPGGVERTALALAKAWKDAGAQIEVVLGRTSGAARNDAPVLHYVQRQEPFPTAWCETIWMIYCLWRQLRDRPADLIFCAGNTYAIVAVAMKVLLGKQCPPIIAKISNDLTRRDMILPLRLAHHLWLKIQGWLIDSFIGMAEPSRQEIAAAMGVAPSRVTIIEDPALCPDQLARLLAIRRSREPKWGSKIVAIGRLVPQKNFSLLIRAFANYCWSADRLTIVGDGPERDELNGLARQLGVSNRVEFAGHVSDVTAWLAASDIFVLSSDFEGVPAAVIEALASAMPIVSTDCSVNMSTLLGSGRFGLLVPPRDEAALGAALNLARTFDVPTNEVRSFASRFTVENAAGRYLDLMKRMEPTTGYQPAREKY